MSDIRFTSHCAFEGLCNQYYPPYNNHNIPCNGKNKNTEMRCKYDSRSNLLTEQSACPFSDGCGDDNCCWPCDKWFFCHDNQMREEGAKAERRLMLEKLKKKIKFAQEPHLDSDARFWDGYKACAEGIRESLRHGQKQERRQGTTREAGGR